VPTVSCYGEKKRKFEEFMKGKIMGNLRHIILERVTASRYGTKLN
jgi:hypothetical protein